MIKIGDKVKFLNDIGGGVVTGFAGKNMVYVENYDGFEIPYPISQLLNIDEPALNKAPVGRSQDIQKPVSVQKPQTSVPVGEIINGKDAPDFYCCFVPDDAQNPMSGNIQIFMVNDSNFTCLFRYTHFKNGEYRTIKQGTLQSNSKIMLSTLSQNEISDLPEFGFQLIIFRDREDDWHEPIVKKLKINPLKFYKETSFQFSRFFGANAMVIQISKNILAAEIDKLTEADFQKLVQDKMEKPAEEKPVRISTPDMLEIDLHINELIDNPAGLSNGQILEIQKEKVESEMKSAIQTRVKKIVFIHGVGQGILKQEVIDLLKTKYRKYYFQDASFKEYGYGATMVILRK